MQTKELYSLANWFIESLQNSGLMTAYQHGVHNITTGTNAAKLVKHKRLSLDEIQSALNKIDCSGLNDAHLKVLSRLQLDSVILEPAKQSITSLLSSNMDKNFIITTLTAHVAVLQQVVSLMSPIVTTLPKLLTGDDLNQVKIPEDKSIMRLTFHKEASIENIVSLKDWSKSWHTIARGFSLANNFPPEEFEIVSVDRGSAIIELALNFETITLINEVLTSFADLATSLTELYLALESMKVMERVWGKEKYETVVKETVRELETVELRIIDDVVSELENNKKITNLKAKNELSSAIRELINFNDKGGSIKCLTYKKDNEKQVESINASFLRIQNHTEIKSIEDKSGDKK